MAHVPYADSKGPGERAQPNLDILCLSTYTTVSIDYVSRQWRP